MNQDKLFLAWVYIIIPTFITSIICGISLFLIFKGKIKFKNIFKFSAISFLIGFVISSGSYIIILPILAIVTIFQLRGKNPTEIS